MIKLVAIDLDGTLLDPNRQITAEVKTAVKKLKRLALKLSLQLADLYLVLLIF
ncbi:hypothetical protein ICE98_02454 [Lactococcus lactis]|nr:hypothetical protein [Lactococcus lactis]